MFAYVRCYYEDENGYSVEWYLKQLEDELPKKKRRYQEMAIIRSLNPYKKHNHVLRQNKSKHKYIIVDGVKKNYVPGAMVFWR